MTARVTALRSGLGRGGGPVELLGGRSGHVERGRGMLQPVQFAVALLELLAQFPVLGLELLQPSEDLPSLLAGKGDGAVVLGGEEKP